MVHNSFLDMHDLNEFQLTQFEKSFNRCHKLKRALKLKNEKIHARFNIIYMFTLFILSGICLLFKRKVVFAKYCLTLAFVKLDITK